MVKCYQLKLCLHIEHLRRTASLLSLSHAAMHPGFLPHAPIKSLRRSDGSIPSLPSPKKEGYTPTHEHAYVDGMVHPDDSSPLQTGVFFTSMVHVFRVMCSTSDQN